MAYAMITPPDVPADRAAALQKAFMEMCRDSEFVAEAKKYSLDLSPIDGEAVRQLLVKAAQTPKAVVDNYNEIVGVAKK